MNILLKGLQWVTAENYFSGDVRIRDERIDALGKDLIPERNETLIHFENHFIYPGLINSHDHLEMNLYPKLGHPPYQNYVEWGNDIYKPRESPVREIEGTDIEDRLLWGGIKNLISGVTTVAHHNPWKKILGQNDFPVKVLNTAGWAHSLAFGKNIKADFLAAGRRPFIIHAAEGVDSMAFGEIEKLDALGVLGQNTILIHAIALSPKDKELLIARKCAVVWCPASNEFLFHKTADIHELKKRLPVALGSDSTLTGSPVLLTEMATAFQTGLATPREIFDMVTLIPSQILNTSKPELKRNAYADLLIAPAVHTDYFENLLHIGPAQVAAVFINGNPKYADPNIGDELNLKHSFKVEGAEKRSSMDISALRNRLRKKAGSGILDTNPLWKMLED